MSKRFILLLASLFVLLGLTPADSQYIRFQSLVSNPGFENLKAGWTAAGSGSFTINQTAANVGEGISAAAFDAAANNDTLTSAQITIPAGLYGQACRLEFLQKGGDSNLTAKVIDGSLANIVTLALTARTNYTTIPLDFTCPTSGTFAVQFIASANAAVMYLDKVNLLLPESLGTTANAGAVSTGTQSFAGTKTFTGNVTIGQDSTAATRMLEVRSATSQRAGIDFYQNGTAKTTISTANGNNDLTSGTTAGDTVIRSQNSSDIFFTADGGSTTHARMNTDGSQVYGATDANVKIGGYFFGSAWIGAAADQTAGTCAPNCTVTSDYGNMVDTVTRSGTGAYSVNFTGSFWSSGPTCVVSSTRGGTSSCVISASGVSTTSYPVTCYTDAGAAIDSRFSIMCHGTR